MNSFYYESKFKINNFFFFVGGGGGGGGGGGRVSECFVTKNHSLKTNFFLG